MVDVAAWRQADDGAMAQTNACGLRDSRGNASLHRWRPEEGLRAHGLRISMGGLSPREWGRSNRDTVTTLENKRFPQFLNRDGAGRVSRFCRSREPLENKALSRCHGLFVPGTGRGGVATSGVTTLLPRSFDSVSFTDDDDRVEPLVAVPTGAADSGQCCFRCRSPGRFHSSAGWWSQRFPEDWGGDDMSWSGWVAPGDYSPGAPTDPDVPNSGIRLLRLQNRCTTIHTVNDAR